MSATDVSEDGEPTLGLRERKRRRVENAIERAAVELALELGHEAVTVAEICERAEVSRSTFFNYMPSREAAIFGKPIELVDRELAMHILDTVQADLPRSLLVVMAASLEHLEVNAQVAAGRRQLAAEQSGVAAAQTVMFAQFREDLTGLAMEWLAANPQRRALPDASVSREALLAVGIAASVGIVMIDRIAEFEDDVTLAEEAFEEVLADLLAVVASMAQP